MFRNSCVQVTDRLAKIRCGTATTREGNTKQDLKALGILSLKVKSCDKRKVGRKTNLIFRWGKAEEQRREIWVRI